MPSKSNKKHEFMIDCSNEYSDFITQVFDNVKVCEICNKNIKCFDADKNESKKEKSS